MYWDLGLGLSIIFERSKSVHLRLSPLLILAPRFYLLLVTNCILTWCGIEREHSSSWTSNFYQVDKVIITSPQSNPMKLSTSCCQISSRLVLHFHSVSVKQILPSKMKFIIVEEVYIPTYYQFTFWNEIHNCWYCFSET